MSGGKFEVKFYEPGALIPPLECFDAVSRGSIESCWTTPGYDTGKYPSLAFFTAVPFGPSVGEFLAWKWFGGGNKMRDEIYEKHGMVARDCFCIAPETSGWFRKEVKSIDELKGLKMRFFGLGAQVMAKLGVSMQLLAAADIYPALERGVIDATEFSMPTMDVKLGLPPDRQVQLLPRLAPAGLVQPSPDEQEGVGRAARTVQGDDRGRGPGADRLHLRRDRGHAVRSSWPRCATSTRCRSSAGATRTWRPSRRHGSTCSAKSRPKIRCSRRLPITISTSARSTPSGAMRRR